jgi:hypothetical protein
MKVKRQEALNLMEEKISTVNMRKHCLAVEAIMRALAVRLGQDPESWGLAGLLHDIDYEGTRDDLARHSLVGTTWLEEWGLPADIVYAVKVHNSYHGLPRRSLLDSAVYACDPLTGLIIAAALIRPEKKLSFVDVPFLLNRFQEKGFARGARREQILACSELGLTLEEFLNIGLASMQGIADELGL